MGTCASAALDYHEDMHFKDRNYKDESGSRITTNADLITIRIKMIKAEQFDVSLHNDASIMELKNIIEKITNIEPDLQTLICRGKGILKSNNNLKDYAIKTGSIVCVWFDRNTWHTEPIRSNQQNIADSEWKLMGNLPKHCKSSFICRYRLNDSAAADIINVCDEGIFRYNVFRNRWSLHTQIFKNSFSINSASIDHSSKCNNLYINVLDNYFQSKFYKCEFQKDQFQIDSMDIERDLCDIHGCNDEFIEHSIVINGEYHIFAHDSELKNLQHLILDNKTKKFDKIHDFQTALGNFGLVFVEKQQTLLLIGGLAPFCIGQYFLTDIYSLSLAKTETERIDWVQLDNTRLSLPLADPMCVLTSDQKNVIILGGSMENTNNDGMEYEQSNQSSTMNDIQYKDVDFIYVLNLETMVVNQCKINCPKPGVFNAVIHVLSANVKHQIVTECVQRFHQKYVSTDIITVIKSFYELEKIHLFERNGIDKMHWTISVDAILNST